MKKEEKEDTAKEKANAHLPLQRLQLGAFASVEADGLAEIPRVAVGLAELSLA